MSGGWDTGDRDHAEPTGPTPGIVDEGFRLFFPLAAVYAAVWPVIWVVALGFDLPLATRVSPSLWHAHEMLVGAFGAALIGFVTTAAPEWTDTEPLRGRPLWMLAVLWGAGRVVGAFGWDGMGIAGAVVDLAWMLILIAYLLRLSVLRATDRLLAFVFWLSILVMCTAATRFAFASDDMELASASVHWIGFAYLGLLGIALSRITVPVTNLILDPSEETAPFRPHPGRVNLAPGLVLVALSGDVIGLSPAVAGFLVCAAGAAFLDRLAEHFIGRAAFRAEILLLGGASGLAGIGLLMTGAARLGAPWSEVAGFHVALMGGLGLGVYAVFCIAGLLHTDRPLGLPAAARAGGAMLAAAVALRILPDLGVTLPGPMHGFAALVWAGGFLAWLFAYWPLFRHPGPARRSHPVEGSFAADGPAIRSRAIAE
ncbi:MAG: NnrS family protein [Pseudomonadota bacterium]